MRDETATFTVDAAPLEMAFNALSSAVPDHVFEDRAFGPITKDQAAATLARQIEFRISAGMTNEGLRGFIENAQINARAFYQPKRASPAEPHSVCKIV